jgi:hypothetical protein
MAKKKTLGEVREILQRALGQQGYEGSIEDILAYIKGLKAITGLDVCEGDAHTLNTLRDELTFKCGPFWGTHPLLDLSGTPVWMIVSFNVITRGSIYKGRSEVKMSNHTVIDLGTFSVYNYEFTAKPPSQKTFEGMVRERSKPFWDLKSNGILVRRPTPLNKTELAQARYLVKQASNKPLQEGVDPTLQRRKEERFIRLEESIVANAIARGTYKPTIKKVDTPSGA